MNNRTTRRKTRTGKVVSTKMAKSIVVSVERRVPHPLYKKYFRRTTTLMAHDEKSEAGIGDTVKIMETRPISKLKRWRLIEIVSKAK
ncbi:MAG: 30S ribosomal protein S17 [Ignavibacteriales bacterium]|nr:30S ribosomal protein S17 [Ignavibacteriales bacterium]